MLKTQTLSYAETVRPEGTATTQFVTRLGGISGIILALMMIVAFALEGMIIATTQGQPVLSTENIGADLLRARSSAIWVPKTWLYALMVIPFPWFMLAVYRALREQKESGFAAVGFFAASLFWIFHTLHNLVVLAILQTLLPRYAATSPDGASIQVTAIALNGVSDLLFGFGNSIGQLFLIGSLSMIGIATLRGVGLPRWTGYVALASALLGSLAYLQFLSSPLNLAFGLPSWVLFFVWVLGTSMALLRSRDARQD